MVNKYLYVLIVFLVLSQAPQAHAIAEPRLSSTSGVIKKEIKEIKTNLKSTIALEKKNLKAEFKLRVKELRDTKKTALVTKIDKKLATVNNKRMTAMNLTLSKLNTILNQIITKVNLAKTQNKNTASVDAAVNKAKAAIAAAETAVSSQSTKEYVIQITTESALKVNVGSTVSQLERDLKAVHKLVVDAKQAVQKAAQELANIQGERSVTPKLNINAN